jgi:hypothetical protein
MLEICRFLSIKSYGNDFTFVLPRLKKISTNKAFFVTPAQRKTVYFTMATRIDDLCN